jgi:hypothetical protein
MSTNGRRDSASTADALADLEGEQGVERHVRHDRRAVDGEHVVADLTPSLSVAIVATTSEAERRQSWLCPNRVTFSSTGPAA